MGNLVTVQTCAKLYWTPCLCNSCTKTFDMLLTILLFAVLFLRAICLMRKGELIRLRSQWFDKETTLLVKNWTCHPVIHHVPYERLSMHSLLQGKGYAYRRWSAFLAWMPNCSACFRKRQSVLVRRPSGEAQLRFIIQRFWMTQHRRWFSLSRGRMMSCNNWPAKRICFLRTLGVCWKIVFQPSAKTRKWGWSVSLPKWHSLLAARKKRQMLLICTGGFAYFCQTGLKDFGDGQDRPPPKKMAELFLKQKTGCLKPTSRSCRRFIPEPEFQQWMEDYSRAQTSMQEQMLVTGVIL